MFINIDLFHIVFSNDSVVSRNVKWNVGDRLKRNSLLKTKMQQLVFTYLDAIDGVMCSIWLCFFCVSVCFYDNGGDYREGLFTVMESVPADRVGYEGRSCKLLFFVVAREVFEPVSRPTFTRNVPVNRSRWTDYVYCRSVTASEINLL